MKTICLIFFFFLFPMVAFSQTFKWADEKGNIHFTDDYSQIPEKYRPNVIKVDMPTEVVEPKTTQKEESKSSEAPSSQKKEETERDRLGRGEDYWRGRVEEWRTRLKDSQGRVDALRIKYNELTEKYNSSKSSVERANLRNEREKIRDEMNRYKNQMEQAKVMIEKKIPDEAELYKAKPEWIK